MFNCLVADILNYYGLTLLSQLTAAGHENEAVSRLLFGEQVTSPLRKRFLSSTLGEALVGEVTEPLPLIPEQWSYFDSRLSRLTLALLDKAGSHLPELLEKYPKDRIGVVIGSSTSGIGASEEAYLQRDSSGLFPAWYRYYQQEIGAASVFLASHLGLRGPAFTVSTACSSSAKAFASARALVELGCCDAVLTGGIDTLCRLTVGGFSSLQLLSDELTNPFSMNRCGLNIGEGGALFLLSRSTDTPYLLLGVGESSDAYHVSSPHPEGRGAIDAITKALSDAGMTKEDVGYVNLHGTGTLLNDAMEARAVSSVIGSDVPCSSTKPITGHTLGAAGAVELAFCVRALEEKRLPLHRFDGNYDECLPAIHLVQDFEALESGKMILSNSFAFGGSNCCVAVGCS